MAEKDKSENTENQNPMEITLEGGTYEIIRNRLSTQGKELQVRVEKLNKARKEVFGAIENKLLGTNRITTQNNCVPRDMVPVGASSFIFGFNVHIGLRSETVAEDVFAIYEFKDHAFQPLPLDLIADKQFRTDFKNLYRYYKTAQFVKFSLIDHYLYMVFQVGKRVADIKVFKWLVKDSRLVYVDNRSEHEFKYPPQHEFDWTRTHRELHRDGLHPHISVEDRLFVETVGGDLTIKIEDNTNTGEGIYAEPVEYEEQTLDDAEIFYATVGSLILLKIKPFKEKDFRFLIYNEKTKEVRRADAIEDSCVLLPDGHGLIFSKGYYLETGEFKAFDHDLKDMFFDHRIVAPNGEDFLFVFHNRESGAYVLLSYNIIEQKVEIPTICHGYAHFENGEMIYFKSEGVPQKHHTVQIWQTQYVANTYSPPVSDNSHLFKIGNKDIVHCMAECYEVYNLTLRDDNYANLYLDLVKKSGDVLDSYFWLNEPEAFRLDEILREIKATATGALDEFEKVVKLRRSTKAELDRVQKACASSIENVKRADFKEIEKYVDGLAELRNLRGEIISLKDLRYVDLPAVEALEIEVGKATETLSQACVTFLLQEEALLPYAVKIDEQQKKIDAVMKVAEARELTEEMDATGAGLDLLIEIVSNLKIDDATQTTQIIDNISAIYTNLNRNKAALKKRQKELFSAEAAAEFSAQLKLLEQGLINYLDACDTPAKCDEYLTRLSVQLEELEGKFIDFDEFTVKLSEKREEIYNAFDNRKLSLTEARNKRTTALYSAAERILKGVSNRIARCNSVSEINGYFASDLMVDKVRDIVSGLNELGDSVKADDIRTQLKTVQSDAIRQLKDKQELFEDGEHVLRFGAHRFSVNTQELDATIVARDDAMFFHLSGTKFFEQITDKAFLQTRNVWQQELLSENAEVYRAEYLAYTMLRSAEQGGIAPPAEICKLKSKALTELVQGFMSQRYDEGYTKGVHDQDTAKMLQALCEMSENIGLLRFAPEVRACAAVFWQTFLAPEEKARFEARLQGMGALAQLFPKNGQGEAYMEDLQTSLAQFTCETELFEQQLAEPAARYLFQELVRGEDFTISQNACDLQDGFLKFLTRKKFKAKFNDAIKKLSCDPVGRFELIRSWLSAFTNHNGFIAQADYLPEAATLLFNGRFDKTRVLKASGVRKISGMLGDHPVVTSGEYELDYIRFMDKLSRFENDAVPKFRSYVELKKSLVQDFRQKLNLDDFKPKVMTSFVRNQLIDKVYLPLIGDNLARQLGTVGESNRTDRMGMLLLISPPGYGKTTLMEYIANRLGITFVKINGPAIGHKVTSLDPGEATNASAREEIEKLNLGLEMGDNVMLYIDDIQHCNPEFLQKFISLCDAQRKIEGVYRGKSRTYDLRGRKVAVVMAGNPYTESGERFQIPDMLANRADTYNLGDIIGEHREAFVLSYLENCLTSNPILSKIANKSRNDIYTFLRIADTGDRGELDFETNYTTEEINEAVGVLKKLARVRYVVLTVNQEYIRSASQAEAYRTEPPFKLQGSYRNMNRIAEKVLPIMNDEELETLIFSSYEQDAQTLTSGAEANLLKFRELLGKLASEQSARWQEIKKTFRKNLAFGSVDSQDRLGQLMVQLSSMGDGLEGIRAALEARQKAVVPVRKPSKRPK